jgi:hypothetical protein
MSERLRLVTPMLLQSEHHWPLLSHLRIIDHLAWVILMVGEKIHCRAMIYDDEDIEGSSLYSMSAVIRSRNIKLSQLPIYYKCQSRGGSWLAWVSD